MLKSKANYNSNLQKAGAAILDTKTLLLNWQPNLSIKENSQLIINENILGKKSRKRTKDVLSCIFIPRYIEGYPKQHWVYLKKLAESKIEDNIFNQILYFYCALNEPLIPDFIEESILPKYRKGILEISSSEVINFINSCIKSGKITSSWSEDVIKRVASGLFAALTEFGILEGNRSRKISSKIIPLPVFYYVSFFLYKQENLSGNKLLMNNFWDLFLLNAIEVEHLFMEAHALKYLRFEQLGNLTRIDFYENKFEEAIDVVISRSS